MYYEEIRGTGSKPVGVVKTRPDDFRRDLEEHRTPRERRLST